MVEPYVEALRYLTPLGFDVLTFAIIDRLAGSGVLLLGSITARPDGDATWHEQTWSGVSADGNLPQLLARVLVTGMLDGLRYATCGTS